MIEQRSGHRWHGENFDHYLGILENAGVDVHRSAQKILTNPASRPNPIHSDIMRLFRDPESVRIVTTNFDEHFSTVAAAVHGPITDFAAPALPVGNRFSGIVYVHGSVCDQPERLVLTDRDFGKAYSTEGWARRFLVDAFRKYTVLFVGYSHNDPPMVYLTRGLTPEADKLFAISLDTEDAHWRHLGITPIPYQLRSGSSAHSAVQQGIQAWADYSAMRVLDHKARLTQLLKHPPGSLSDCDHSYLKRCFATRQLLPLFYEDGLQVAWLLWAENAGLLAPAFSPPTDIDRAYAQQLAHWFSRHAVQNHAEAAAVYMRANMAMPEHLWYQVGQAYHSARKANPAGRAKWAAQMCMHWRPAYATNFLEYAMTSAAEAGEFATALMILEFLSTPRIIHERSFRSSSDPAEANTTSLRVKITTTHGTHWFEELWTKHLQPQLATFASRLAEMATSKLDQAYELQAVHAAPAEPFDEVSHKRSAIEPSQQDDYRTEFHVLVDIARDSFEHLLKHDRPLALALRTRWIASRSPLLIRLAVHGIRIDARVSADKKLRWLIGRDLLAPISLHHEVFILLRDTFPLATPQTQRAFLTYVRKATLADIRRHPDIEAAAFWHHEFSLLDTLVKGPAGACRPLRLRLAYIRKKFPNFRAEHPEFTHWSSGVMNGSRSPITAGELCAKPPAEALRYLVTFKSDHWLGPRRDGLVYTLQTAVTESPEWGLDIAQRLAKRKRYPNDIWPAIVRGWGSANMPPKSWHNILAFLAAGQIGDPPLREIAQLLYHAISIGEGALPESELGNAERLAFSALTLARSKTTPAKTPDDWHSWAISDTGGIICEFLLHAASKRRQKTKSRWRGLPSSYKQHFRKMLAGRTPTDQAGRTVLASHLHYFFTWDPSWTADSLFPIFDWHRDPLCATQAWHGFLTAGKWKDKYLQRLLPHYRQSVLRMHGPLQKLADHLAGHVACICLLSHSHRARGHLLVDFFTAADEKQRVTFANTIRSALDDAKPKDRHAMWTDWLREYWEERNLGKPAPLTPGEVKAMIPWCPLLEDHFPDAVDVLCEGRVSGGSDLFSLHDFPKTGLATRFPEATARFVLYLVSNHGSDYLHAPHVLDVCKQLIPETQAYAILRALVELLACKGCIQESVDLDSALRALPATVGTHGNATTQS